jgi:hypothetical protein
MNRVAVFSMRELPQALAHAAAGGLACHLHCVMSRRGPRCFRAALARGEHIAHLFGKCVPVLRAEARRLGVRVVLVEHEGRESQHVDLCGTPLRRLLAEAGCPDRIWRSIPS